MNQNTLNGIIYVRKTLTGFCWIFVFIMVMNIFMLRPETKPDIALKISSLFFSVLYITRNVVASFIEGYEGKKN